MSVFRVGKYFILDGRCYKATGKQPKQADEFLKAHKAKHRAPVFAEYARGYVTELPGDRLPATDSGAPPNLRLSSPICFG